VAVRSPFPRARFGFGDIERFRSTTPGVLDVMVAADVPGRNRFGVIPPEVDQPMLAEEAVRFQGEAVALVAFEPGVTPDVSTFPVVWELQEPLLSPDDAAAVDAPLLHRERSGNVLVRGYVQSGPDDAFDTAQARAEQVEVSGTFETSFVEHAYIEPEAGWADLVDGNVVINVTTQAPHMDRDETAAVLGLQPEQVIIRPTACGGGFGGKLDLSLQPLLGLAALRLRRPVRMTFTRSESMATTTKRHPATMSATVRASSNGELQSLDFEGVFDTGAYASWGPTVANRVPIHAGGPYRYRAYRARTEAIHTNQPPSGAFRGFGVPQAAIAQEGLFDELADRIGIDPLEFRIRNAIRAGVPTVTGQVFAAGVGYVECLEALREPYREAVARAAEHNRVAEQAPVGAVPWRAGVGVAGAWYGCGNTAMPNPSTVRIGLTADGRILLHQGAVDIGQGANTVMSQICADALGLPLDAVSLVGADTDITPDAGKTSASRQTYITGNATHLAARDLVRRLASLAGFDGAATDAAELDLAGTAVEVSSADRTVTVDLANLPVDQQGYVATGLGTYDAPTSALDERGQGEPYAVFGFGAQLVELRVDTETGVVELVGIDAAYDVGRAVNPGLVAGQIIGGAAQGIGLALMEEYVPGRNDNLHDYLIPTIGDVPEVRVTLVESNDPLGPHGAKGIGEHALIPTAPAVLNAIRNAIGAPVRTVPATPERVLEAIRGG
jgi:CO/xanthine dehydrogenase Mo-binding subunit